MKKTTGSEYLARALEGYGVDHVFYVPAVLLRTMAALEAGGTRRILAHSEKAAAYMADGYARASLRPGVCFAQNIGGSNLASGLRDAFMARVPVIAMSGGPNYKSRHRNYYQEVEDFAQFDAVTKLNATVDHVSRLPDLLRQAFREATSGAPGPVHLRLPGVTGDDTLGGELDAELVVETRHRQVPAYRPGAEPTQIDAALKALRAAKRPIIVAGGGVALSGAQAELVKLAGKLAIPVATSLNAKGAIADDHPLSAGICGTYSRACANRAVAEADLVFFVASATGGQVTTHWQVPKPGTRTIHLDIEATQIGRNYPDTLPLVGDARTVLAQLVAALGKAKGDFDGAWPKRVRRLVAAWRRSEKANFDSAAVPLRPERVCRALTETLPDNAILVADTGHSGMWTGQMVDFIRPGQRLIRCAGSLGWSLPGAIGVKCGAPDRPVVCFAGDGAAYYHLPELETAARFGIKVVFVINNNAALSQEVQLYRMFGGAPFTERTPELWKFRPVSFANIAREFGCASWTVEKPADLNRAITAALAADGPAVVDVLTDPAIEAKNGWTPEGPGH